jgi:hypothetical protein
VAVLSAICRQSGHKPFGADLHHVGMRGHRDGLRLRLSDPTPGSDPQNVPSGSLASEDSEEEGLEPQREVGGDLNNWTWNRSVPVSTSHAVSTAEVTRRRTGYGRVIANRGRGRSVSVVSGYGLDDRGSIPGRGERIFLLASVSRPALGPTQPPFKWVPWVLSTGL